MAFWRSYAHLIWTTKNRQPWIHESWEERLYGQIVKKASELDCYVYAINGICDHVHIVLATPPKHSISHIVQNLKGSSSHFVNHIIRPTGYHFAWQRGYGIFTLGQTQIDQAITYVKKQKENHANFSTNGWLERCTDENEGPDIAGWQSNHSEGVTNAISEERIAYNAFGDFPF